MEKLINDLNEALSEEIGVLLRDKSVYIDRERLRGGDFYKEALSLALCKSVCMIMIFTPTYFDPNHKFCTREFKAMEILEKRRLGLLEGQIEEPHGLIIPIILRGENYLPQFIKQKRQYYNFEGYIRPKNNNENILCTHRRYNSEIKEIAKYIYESYSMLESIGDISDECKSFRLPSDEEVKDILNNVNFKGVPFPGQGLNR
jgi:hypothetical protein